MNPEEFIAKLESIFSNLNLTPSMFADQIGVQRSSISHLLSGRNKPSLDFVLKIVDTFPQIDLYWLLGQKESSETLDMKVQRPSPAISEAVENEPKEEKKKAKILEEKPQSKKDIPSIRNSEVEKIVIFYRDGTFSEYSSREI